MLAINKPWVRVICAFKAKFGVLFQAWDNGPGESLMVLYNTIGMKITDGQHLFEMHWVHPNQTSPVTRLTIKTETEEVEAELTSDADVFTFLSKTLNAAGFPQFNFGNA